MYSTITNEICPIQVISSKQQVQKSIGSEKAVSIRKNAVTAASSGKKGRSAEFYYILSVLPMIVFTYIQLLFNLIMVGFVIYSMIKLKNVLLADLAKHMDKQEHLLFSKILDCSRDYLKNKCNAIDVPPALEGHCSSWKLCMEQDVNNILQSAESAAVLAQILNNFFDSLSNRTIICSGGILLGSILFANMVLSWSKRGVYRNKPSSIGLLERN